MSNKIRSIQREREKRQAKEGELDLTISELIVCGVQSQQNPTPSLSVLLGDPNIPIRESLLIARVAKTMQGEIETYEAIRKALCEKYAEKDEKGVPRMVDAEGKQVTGDQPGRYDISPEKMADFNKEHQELLGTRITIPGAKVRASDLAEVKIAPVHLMNLTWLLED